MLGVIGGTGLYQLEGVEEIATKTIASPFGQAAVKLCQLEGKQFCFLPRHGGGHALLPSEINYRANIYALKSLGVEQILSVSATGSLKNEFHPGDLVLVDQYIDHTRGERKRTFFGEGLIAHVSTAKPVCATLQEHVYQCAQQEKTGIHKNGTYICVEGPRLGTKAESKMLQGFGANLVGMTNVPEVFLAREAQICYATIAVVTDYDCWKEDEKDFVSVDKVFALYRENINKVQGIIKSVIMNHNISTKCSCRSSLQYALMTAAENLSTEKQELLKVLQK